MNRSFAATCTVALGISCASTRAQTPPAAAATARQSATCSNGAPFGGVVRDTTGATVAEAAITLEDGTATQTGGDGRGRAVHVLQVLHRKQTAPNQASPCRWARFLLCMQAKRYVCWNTYSKDIFWSR